MAERDVYKRQYVSIHTAEAVLAGAAVKSCPSAVEDAVALYPVE